VQSTPDKGLPKPGSGGSNAHVTGQRQVHTSPCGRAIHRGNDRFGGITHGKDNFIAYGGNAVEQRSLHSALLHLMRSFHIATGTKPTASPGQHDDTRRGIVTGAYHGLIQLLAQGVSQSV
jgi:hypothetical protein